MSRDILRNRDIRILELESQTLESQTLYQNIRILEQKTEDRILEDRILESQTLEFFRILEIETSQNRDILRICRDILRIQSNIYDGAFL